jgi:hypothetical protein
METRNPQSGCVVCRCSMVRDGVRGEGGLAADVPLDKLRGVIVEFVILFVVEILSLAGRYIKRWCVSLWRESVRRDGCCQRVSVVMDLSISRRRLTLNKSQSCYPTDIGSSTTLLVLKTKHPLLLCARCCSFAEAKRNRPTRFVCEHPC